MEKTAHRVGIVVFDGVRLLDVAGPSEVLMEANRHGADYRVHMISVGGRSVATSTGLSISVDGDACEPTRWDTLIVPGGDRLPVAPLPPDLVAVVELLAGLAGRTCSVCTGAFILARAGLLQGLRATTHWRHTRLLQAAFPDVSVDPDAIYVEDGGIFTSAGVAAGIDLALALVERDGGAEVARSVARSLVVFLHRPGGQSQFSASMSLPRARSEILRSVMDAVATDPAGEHTPSRMARAASVSTRHLTRMFTDEVGITPAKYVEAVRLDAAAAALARGVKVGVAARLAGFPNPEALRRSFLRRRGVSPSDYQQRFSSAIRPASRVDRRENRPAGAPVRP
jgi:transcriptional regulator GlxA family with amidase domain